MKDSRLGVQTADSVNGTTITILFLSLAVCDELPARISARLGNRRVDEVRVYCSPRAR